MNVLLRVFVVVLSFQAVFFAVAHDIEGTWTGDLQVTSQVKLKLVLHVSQPVGEAHAVATMDSPDQGAFGIPAEVKHLSADSLSVVVPAICMSFEGRLNEGKLEGTFSQGGMKLPLSFEPGETAIDRPQMPQPPFPYSTESLVVDNRTAGVSLAGTLTLPEHSSSSTPVVVMVTGSGLQNRDEEVFGHKPFAVIADYLARNGVASFRYDDRGFGESTGNGDSVSTYDFASDAQSVVDTLRACKRFGKVGILGHSEGGSVSFMLGAGNNPPDFIVAVAGPVVRGDSIILWQNIHSLEKSGMPRQMIDEYHAALRKALDYRIENPGKAMPEEYMENICPGWRLKPVYKELADAIESSFGKPDLWIDTFLSYSPSSDILKVKVPMMMIFGEKDTQVSPELNFPIAQRLAGEATVKIYPGLNHLMQHADSGEVIEYARIAETFSPEVLADIVGFILAL